MQLACLVSQIPGQPIIVARLTGSFTAADTDALYAEIDDVSGAFTGPYYRVIDMSEMSVDLAEAAKMLLITLQRGPGTATDPRVIQDIYVGPANGFLVGLERTEPAGLGQRGSSAVFTSLKRALDHIYADMDRTLNGRRGGHRDDPPCTGADPTAMQH